MSELPVTLPEGEYAIVEMLGHRTLIGRVTEVERFGARFLACEPLFQNDLLPPVLIGGASIYQLTPCTPEVALKAQPKRAYSLPSPVEATVDEPSEFAPAFLVGEGED